MQYGCIHFECWFHLGTDVMTNGMATVVVNGLDCQDTYMII